MGLNSVASSDRDKGCAPQCCHYLRKSLNVSAARLRSVSILCGCSHFVRVRWRRYDNSKNADQTWGTNMAWFHTSGEKTEQ